MAAALGCRGHWRCCVANRRWHIGGIEPLRNGIIRMGTPLRGAGIAASPSFWPGRFLPGYPVEIIDIDVDIIIAGMLTVTTMMVSSS